VNRIKTISTLPVFSTSIP